MAERGQQKTQVGVVVSNKMMKTVVVEVERLVQDRRFAKYLRRWKKCKAHDEKAECQVGDKVLLVSTRPLSKEKHWRVQQVLTKAKEA